uniref:Uncharacterized protein n=1 Tax=Arundo donax TaxID=35708 RepID=A0A0A8Y3V3_ARUDO
MGNGFLNTLPEYFYGFGCTCSWFSISVFHLSYLTLIQKTILFFTLKHMVAGALIGLVVHRLVYYWFSFIYLSSFLFCTVVAMAVPSYLLNSCSLFTGWWI